MTVRISSLLREASSPDYLAIFGRNLRAARLQAGLKQSDMASLVGMTQQYLSAVEVGRQNIKLRTMALLAEVIGRPLADLLVVHTPVEDGKETNNCRGGDRGHRQREPGVPE